MTASVARESSIDVSFQPCGSSHGAVGDVLCTKQILINLLSNGIKYTPAGGRPTMGVHGACPGRVSIRVADTGPGIAADEMHRLFVPFDRLGAESSAKGTGLGPAVSRLLAGAMQGGALDAESTVGSGSVFTVAAIPAVSATSGRDAGVAA